MGTSGDLLTTRAAARLLGVGTTSIKRWADAGLLEHVKTPGGHRRFPRAAVLAFAGSAAMEAGPEGGAGAAARWVDFLLSDAHDTAIVHRLESARKGEGWWALAEEMGDVLSELGLRWQRGEISPLQEHTASEKLTRALSTLASAMEVRDRPHAVLFTAEGDHHQLGLRLVEVCLRGEGWNTTFLGDRVPLSFVSEFVAGGDVDLVAVSASEFSADPILLADQARRLGEICSKARVKLAVGGSGAWPVSPAVGSRIEDLAELRALVRKIDGSRPGTWTA